MTNHPDLVSTVFGASLIGAVVVPINARYRTTELQFLIEDADLVALLTHDTADAHVDFTALIEEALEGIEAPKLRHVVMMGRGGRGHALPRDFDALGNGADEKLLRNRVEGVPLRDTALILYTSGTTSNPRGAMLSHEAFVRTWMVTARVWGTESEDRMWSALPLFHVTALGIATWIIGKGATFYSDYAFDAARTRRHAARREDHAVLSRLPAGDRGGARAPGLRQGRPERDQDVAQRRGARGAGEVPEPAAARGPAHGLWRDRGRLRDDHTPRRPARHAPEDMRRLPAGPGAARRRPRGKVLGPGERGIIQFRGYNTLERLLERAREDRREHPRAAAG